MHIHVQHLIKHLLSKHPSIKCDILDVFCPRTIPSRFTFTIFVVQSPCGIHVRLQQYVECRVQMAKSVLYLHM